MARWRRGKCVWWGTSTRGPKPSKPWGCRSKTLTPTPEPAGYCAGDVAGERGVRQRVFEAFTARRPGIPFWALLRPHLGHVDPVRDLARGRPYQAMTVSDVLRRLFRGFPESEQRLEIPDFGDRWSSRGLGFVVTAREAARRSSG